MLLVDCVSVCVHSVQYMHFYYNFWNITQTVRDAGTWSWTVLIIGFFHLYFCSYYVLLASNFVVWCSMFAVFVWFIFMLFFFSAYLYHAPHSLHRCKPIFMQRLTTRLLISSMCVYNEKYARKKPHTETTEKPIVVKLSWVWARFIFIMVCTQNEDREWESEREREKSHSTQHREHTRIKIRYKYWTFTFGGQVNVWGETNHFLMLISSHFFSILFVCLAIKLNWQTELHATCCWRWNYSNESFIFSSFNEISCGLDFTW